LNRIGNVECHVVVAITANELGPTGWFATILLDVLFAYLPNFADPIIEQFLDGIPA
jgi:hypothetical protein